MGLAPCTEARTATVTGNYTINVRATDNLNIPTTSAPVNLGIVRVIGQDAVLDLTPEERLIIHSSHIHP